MIFWGMRTYYKALQKRINRAWLTVLQHFCTSCTRASQTFVKEHSPAFLSELTRLDVTQMILKRKIMVAVLMVFVITVKEVSMLTVAADCGWTISLEAFLSTVLSPNLCLFECVYLQAKYPNIVTLPEGQEGDHIILRNPQLPG